MNESEALGHTFSSWEGQWEGYGSNGPGASSQQVTPTFVKLVGVFQIVQARVQPAVVHSVCAPPIALLLFIYRLDFPLTVVQLIMC